MKNIKRMLCFALVLGLCLTLVYGEKETKAKSSAKDENAQNSKSQFVNDKYPWLTSGILSYAKLGDLPENTLLSFNDLKISDKDLEDEIAKSNIKKDEVEKNKFFILEQIATQKILLQIAKNNDAKEKNEKSNKTDDELIKGYFEQLLSGIEVTDKEVSDFYEKNKDMCGGASLSQIKADLKQYVLGQKKQEKVMEHIHTIGQKNSIIVSSSWVEKQSSLAKDNPVDKARSSGKPSLVDFGSTGCRPCDMMAPILETLKKKYEGKANVLFVHVGEHRMLAGRYGIQSIPVQIFFDKDGKEIFRHTGFFPQVEVEKKMKELGVE